MQRRTSFRITPSAIDNQGNRTAAIRVLVLGAAAAR
jgi:hypothetical protein